jgi:hypothetical protein
MLKVSSRYRRLAILVDPDGDFYTPSCPEDYSEGQAMGEMLLGKRLYCFQRLGVREKSFWRRTKWVAEVELCRFEHYPRGWEILEGRPWKTPKTITPEKARKLREGHE